MPFDASLVQQGEFSERGGYPAAEALFAGSPAPSAIMFQSDCMAIGAYRKLHELGLTPGKDVAIVAAVLTGEVQDYLWPRMTVLRSQSASLACAWPKQCLRDCPCIGAYYNNAMVQEIWPL